MGNFWVTVLEFAQQTAEQVGTQLHQDFGHVNAQEKADGSLVTMADHQADQTLHQAIRTNFPHHGILSEEAGHTFPGSDWCWVIDPLDGTTNFARGIPLWGISLGLLYQGTPVFGYVSLPPINQAFYGFDHPAAPTGAFLNGRLLPPPAHTLSSNHFVSLCTRSVALLTQAFPCKVRVLGVSTYNLLLAAKGATLGGVEATPKIWDIAAVWVILQAAGVVWYPLSTEPIFPLVVGHDYGSQSYPTLVVTDSSLLADFLPLVQPLVRS